MTRQEYVLLTNVIRDEQAAIQEIQTADVEMPKQNRKNGIWNVCLVLVLIVTILVPLVTLTYHLCKPNGMLNIMHDKAAGVVSVVVSACVASFICWTLYIMWGKVILAPCEWYSANAKFFQLTNGYNILYIIVHRNENNSWWIHITMEDENHVVLSRALCCPELKQCVCTNITEICVNLLEETIYIPYHQLTITERKDCNNEQNV